MTNKKEQKDTLLTILSKSAILLINFAIVVFTTRFWGAEGKGYIAIFTANLGLISIVTNIFTNSSISYFVRKIGASKLYAQACLWIFISSSLGVLICYIIDHNSYLFLLLIASVLTGYLTFHNALYIGMQKIKYFNLITILQPLFLLIFMNLFYYLTKTSYFDYFYAHIISFIIVIIISLFLTRKTVGKIKMQLDFAVTKQTFNYGFQNELSSFLQFFVCRLCYYFIIYYLGERSLGIFSVGIAISESTWIVCRSISMIQYSKIIKEGNTKNARKGVVRSSFISVIATSVSVLIILLLPKSIFAQIFGNEFSEVKQIVLLMSPGILSIAFSNIYGHFFAAIGKLKILILKSLVGVIITVPLSIVLIPLWKMEGACIANSIVHFTCSAIIVFYFIVVKNKNLSND